MSNFWQWFFAILSVAAFLMAGPSFLQLIFGQPKLGYTFREDNTGNDGKLIKMHIMNVPVSNWFLKLFRVTRLPVQDFYIGVAVSNESTKEAITDFLLEISTSASSKDGRINMPASIFSSWVTLVKWQKDTNSALLVGRKTSLALPNGRYVFSFHCGVDGKEMRFRQNGLLCVGDTEQELGWDNRIVNKFFVFMEGVR